MNKEFKSWLKTRPVKIREIAKKYPPHGKYIMKEGAPYGISCAGTVVSIYCYNDGGHIGVVVTADNKKPSAIEHEKALCRQHGRTEKEMEEIHKSNTLVWIDPQWLEPYVLN